MIRLLGIEVPLDEFTCSPPPALCLVFKKTAIILSPLGHIVDSIRPDAMKPDKGGPLGPCSGSCLSVVDVEILPKIYWIALFEGIHRYTYSLSPFEFKLLSDCILHSFHPVHMEHQ